MEYYLGVDGGGTKTKFALCDSLGNVLALANKGTCHYQQCGLDGLRDVIAGGLCEVTRTAGVEMESVRAAFVACPGCGEVPRDQPAICKSVADALGSIPHRVGNDSENALAGALGGEPGINAIAGTGSIAFGKNERGETMRCGGWNHAIGSDEGSGYWIGISLLREFMRQSDGRDEKTPLYRAIREKLDLDSDFDVIARVVEEWGLERTRIAALAPLASALYDEGDVFAKKILESAADELSDLAIAIFRGLGFKKGTRVSTTGGVFRMAERIIAPFSERLAALGMAVVPPLLPPEGGALILAMQHAGVPVTDEVRENLIRTISA